MRQSYTAVIERNSEWTGAFATEPYEVSWASEAIFFVRLLEDSTFTAPTDLRVQLSPDGIHWCDEGTHLTLSPETELSWTRVAHFGGWLRLRGNLPPEQVVKVIVYLHLKE